MVVSFAGMLLPSMLAFAPSSLVTVHRFSQQQRGVRLATEQIDEGQLRGKVEQMRVKQIKEELDKLGVAHADAFEKEDLVQRLLDAKDSERGNGDGPQAPPSMNETMAGLEMVMADEDGRKLLEEIQQNPHLMQASMDIAANGLTDKYVDDEEVMQFMRRMEAISKRQAEAEA
jgi:hypothetical protein